jgi:hypothetical protein
MAVTIGKAPNAVEADPERERKRGLCESAVKAQRGDAKLGVNNRVKVALRVWALHESGRTTPIG